MTFLYWLYLAFLGVFGITAGIVCAWFLRAVAKLQQRMNEMEAWAKNHANQNQNTEALIMLNSERLDRLAANIETDALTGAYVRVAGERRMRELIRGGYECVLVFLDINDFGEVNKKHGWETGDAILTNLVAALLETFGRVYDTVARYGGDEFFLVLPVMPGMAKGDGLDRMFTHADQKLREIRDSGVPFTYGIATTRAYGPQKALAEAMETVRLQKQQRDILRQATRDAQPVEIPSKETP